MRWEKGALHQPFKRLLLLLGLGWEAVGGWVAEA